MALDAPGRISYLGCFHSKLAPSGQSRFAGNFYILNSILSLLTVVFDIRTAL